MAEQAGPVRVRYAPSPTGVTHIGGARTALFNYLFARHHQGAFLLRIEDTDRARLQPGSEAQIKEGLTWIGLHWDEPPIVQSEHLPRYRAAAEQLLSSGAAYRCFCTPERLEQMRAEQRARKEPERYDRRCAAIPPEESDRRALAGERFVIRQRMPAQGTTTLHDLIMGTVEFRNDTLDDHVLLKSDGYPTYHLAFAVDDHDSRISHVIRGDGWLPSAPKHLLLFQAFGWEPPAFAHLPLVHGPDHKPLAKRHGARNILEYRDAGYLPEAVVNFIAFLGWSPGTTQDLFTMPELIDAFTIERVQPSPAVANLERLDWLNGQFIRRLPDDDLARRLSPWLPQASPDQIRPLVPLVKERLQTLAQAPDLLAFFFGEPAPLPADAVKDRPAMRQRIEAAVRRLEEAPAWSEVELESRLRATADALQIKHGDFFMALRIALTGRRVTPPLIPSMVQLGRDRVLAILRQRLTELAAG
ncbi:MAG TPA: glutamate--tRNA ligase [Candidatus Limnocylindrales bacterium]|nr:glutamate--tRNA ligase [Candidatus Limnocylindrales bacterium]